MEDFPAFPSLSAILSFKLNQSFFFFKVKIHPQDSRLPHQSVWVTPILLQRIIASCKYRKCRYLSPERGLVHRDTGTSSTLLPHSQNPSWVRHLGQAEGLGSHPRLPCLCLPSPPSPRDNRQVATPKPREPTQGDQQHSDQLTALARRRARRPREAGNPSGNLLTTLSPIQGPARKGAPGSRVPSQPTLLPAGCRPWNDQPHCGPLVWQTARANHCDSHLTASPLRGLTSGKQLPSQGASVYL